MNDEILCQKAITEICTTNEVFIDKETYLPWLKKYASLNKRVWKIGNIKPFSEEFRDLYSSLNFLVNYLEYDNIAQEAMSIYKHIDNKDKTELFNWMGKYYQSLGFDFCLLRTDFNDEKRLKNGYRNLLFEHNSFEVYYALYDFTHLLYFDSIYSKLFHENMEEIEQIYKLQKENELIQNDMKAEMEQIKNALLIIEPEVVYLKKEDYLPWVNNYEKLYYNLRNSDYTNNVHVKDFVKLYNQLRELKILHELNHKFKTALSDYEKAKQSQSLSKWKEVYNPLYMESLTFMACELTSCKKEFVTLFERYGKVFVFVGDFRELKAFRFLFPKTISNQNN